jgi:hypothetical protein
MGVSHFAQRRPPRAAPLAVASAARPLAQPVTMVSAVHLAVRRQLEEPAMDEATFWSLIDRFDWSKDEDDDIIEPAVLALALLPDSQIADFQQILARKLYALDGRAWARNSGESWWGEPDRLSVDGFLYARCLVVANGREFYEAVLADPTAMPKDADFEPLLMLAADAYDRKTGLEWDDLDDTEVSYETFSNEAGWPAL